MKTIVITYLWKLAICQSQYVKCSIHAVLRRKDVAEHLRAMTYGIDEPWIVKNHIGNQIQPTSSQIWHWVKEGFVDVRYKDGRPIGTFETIQSNPWL